MKVHSVIANAIPEEVFTQGHLSIRFMADGFSLLLADRAFSPVVLNRFTFGHSNTLATSIEQCNDWLERHTLVERFSGEATIVLDSPGSILVPDELFNRENPYQDLEPQYHVRVDEYVKYRPIKGREMYQVYAVPGSLLEFSDRFHGKQRILTSSEVCFSVIDQVNASDHQRGFIYTEIQKGFINLMVIRNDELVLSNQLRFEYPDEMVYFVLNTVAKLSLDREKTPLFYSGSAFHEQIALLGKYIRKINPLPYHTPVLEPTAISEHTLLTEATRCE